MKIKLKVSQPTKDQKACLLFGILEAGILSPSAKAWDKAHAGRLSQLIKLSGFTGINGQLLPCFGTNDAIVLIGCGKASDLTPSVYRRILVNSMKTFFTLKVEETISYLGELEVKNQPSMPWKVKQIAEAALEGLYRFDHFKSQKEPPIAIKNFIIHVPSEKMEKVCEIAVKQAEAIADGAIVAKNLANLPSNICTPSYLADEAKALAKKHSEIQVKILNEKQMDQLKMGALLAVSKGSEEEARLICLEYQGGTKKESPVVLIGKGVTFDTGGNSLKPADSMVGMKYDMCGAATVIGVMKAIANLKLPLNVVGIIPTVENMPGGAAYNPEDIVTSMSGQTIEVISTDAEGRLILCDALTYSERYEPEVVIDIATLTGAVVIALGMTATGIFANDDKLAQALIDAGEESNDRGWPLPLWEEYQELLRSPFADMANVGGRAAGAITAACFLSRFAKKFRWAHLDVAGTAAFMAGIGERAATGRPVPMLVQYLITKANAKAGKNAK